MSSIRTTTTTTILALLALARTISADDGTISSASSVSTDVTAVPTAQCASTLSTCDEFVEIDALPYLNSDEQLTVQTHYDDTYGCPPPGADSSGGASNSP